MRISGAAVLNAPRDRVYAALTDPVVLARTIPGCRQLEPAGDDTYRMVVMAGVGSIRGRFTGEVQLRDQQPPLRCVLHASGQGAPGTVHAVTRICLTALEETRTTVEYEADAVVGGMVGGVGQRLLAGAARRMASELFGAVDAELARPAPAPQALAVEPAAALAAAAVAAPAAGLVPEPPPPGRSAGVPPAMLVPSTVPGPVLAGLPAQPGRGADLRSLLAGAAVALAGVAVGWLAGRR